MKVLLYVQHLLGTGHLVRTQQLASAIARRQHQVMLVSGGPVHPQSGYQTVQLPPLKTEPGDFTTLLDMDGNVVNQTWKHDRALKLQDAMIQFAPDAVVIETWPFGRRQMEFELKPLLDILPQCTPIPKVVCSIRDVLQKRKHKRRIETLENLEKYFSLVLIHGDEKLTPLIDSFEEANQIQCPLSYTGFVDRLDRQEQSLDGHGEVVVSAGGGAAGALLIDTAIAASKSHDLNWRVLVGGRVDDFQFNSIQCQSHEKLIVERNRADFLGLLKNATVSVSQFGYNTSIDIVRARCSSVVVPYSADGETEQLQRAELFAQHDQIVMLTEKRLNPKTLIAAVDEAREKSQTERIDISLDGAVNSALIIEQLLGSSSYARN